jgi:hypothetical protein
MPQYSFLLYDDESLWETGTDTDAASMMAGHTAFRRRLVG